MMNFNFISKAFSRGRYQSLTFPTRFYINGYLPIRICFLIICDLIYENELCGSRWNKIYNPLSSAKISNHTEGVSSEEEQVVDLYINNNCVVQPDLNWASIAFGSSCCGENVDFKRLGAKFSIWETKSSHVPDRRTQRMSLAKKHVWWREGETTSLP